MNGKMCEHEIEISITTSRKKPQFDNIAVKAKLASPIPEGYSRVVHLVELKSIFQDKLGPLKSCVAIM